MSVCCPGLNLQSDTWHFPPRRGEEYSDCESLLISRRLCCVLCVITLTLCSMTRLTLRRDPEYQAVSHRGLSWSYTSIQLDWTFFVISSPIPINIQNSSNFWVLI